MGDVLRLMWLSRLANDQEVSQAQLSVVPPFCFRFDCSRWETSSCQLVIDKQKKTGVAVGISTGISDDGPLEPPDCLSGRLVLIATAVRNLLRISRPSVANGDDSLHLHFVLLMSGGRVGTSPIRVYSGENLETKDPISLSLF